MNARHDLSAASPGDSERFRGSGDSCCWNPGILVFAVTAFAGDKSPAIKSDLIFYKPTGPLSGVAVIGVVCWILFCWVLLEWRWGRKNCFREECLHRIPWCCWL